IANVVVGDPATPDLTIDRLMVDVSYGLGAPAIGAVVVERPRLYGAYRDGALSFGALDPVLFAESDGSTTGLLEIDVTVRNGGALLATDFGEVGAYLEGSGPLDDGFAGRLALVAPGLGVEGCSIERATAYGDLTTKAGTPRFEGPIRLRAVACEGAEAASADIGTALSTDTSFTKLEGGFDVATGALNYQGNRAETLKGRATVSVSDGAMVMDHDLVLARVTSPYAHLADLRADGEVRSARGFTQSSWRAQLTGEGVEIASDAIQSLTDARKASEGTLISALLSKLEGGLGTAMREATLRADITAKADGEAFGVVLPEARVQSASGETVLALSRFSWSREGAQGAGQLSGNLLTGGADLPQISGRIDQSDNGALTARFSLAPYTAGGDRIAVPSFTVRGLSGGGYAFSGALNASGAIPGGAVQQFEAPISGRINRAGRVNLGFACQNVAFQRLSAYDLNLDATRLRVCPGESGAMIAYGSQLDLDIMTDGIDLTGDLAGSPTRLAASRASFSYPKGFELSDIDAAIGEPDNAVRITSATLQGSVGEELGGQFSDATAALDAVPLDISQLAGNWSYADSVLRIDQADFTLTERPDPDAGPDAEPRFNPLQSRGATLRLEDGAISALAQLDHKASGTQLTNVAIAHDLSSSTGSALISVPGVAFDGGFSVQDLSDLAKGVIAYTDGVVTGEGRIDWTSDDITSSGVFRTDDLDLAAAFGPVNGIKGEVRFSDLINLTTEPGQVVQIGSINPGIEAIGGTVRFSLTDGTIIKVEDARWPFMDGELIMRPTTLEYGTDKEQRYIFEVIALDAATFVTQMELSNLSANGRFDGTLSIVFDAEGYGRIEDGLLISRAPGGNVSYIGELTYEDMGAISNFAFQSLRSLDYRQMSVGLGGDLAGEIITRFRIDGVSQGVGASQNFVTRRLAKLPIRFNVNVRSENFYELATMVQRFWDPSSIPDPVDQGLISPDELRRGAIGANAPPDPSEPPDPSPNT
ncbi:MAG: YdbH domain-containing protein, partial [Pseudomonadota bacterium]